MTKTRRINLVNKAQAIMADKELAEAIADTIEGERGSLGFLLGMLRNRPRTFNPYVLKGISVYREPVALDRKTAELTAVAAATALRCEHCLDAHIDRAVSAGASLDEVMDTILISAAISESSTLSVAFRKFKIKSEKAKRAER